MYRSNHDYFTGLVEEIYSQIDIEHCESVKQIVLILLK